MPDITGKASLDIEEIKVALSQLVQGMNELNKASDVATEHLKKTSEAATSASKTLSAFKEVAGALGLTLGITGLINFGKSLFDFATVTRNSAETAGISAEQFQRLKAELTGFVGADTATASIQALAEALRQVKNDNPDVQESFKTLGLSIDALKNPATDVRQLVEDLATAYTNASDKTEFLRKAELAFGSDFLKLVPALQQGGTELHKIGDEATVTSNKMVDAAARGAAAWESAFDGIKRGALNASSAISDFGAYLATLDTRSGNWLDRFDRSGAQIPSEVSPDNSDANFNRPKPGARPKVASSEAGDASDIALAQARDAQGNKAAAALHGDDKIDLTGVQPKADNALEIQQRLNAILAQRSTTLASQRAAIVAQSDSLEAQMKLPINANDAARLATLLAQDSAIKQQLADFDLQVRLQNLAASAQAKIMSEQLNGETHLAQQDEIRAKYALQILQAQQEGNDELVKSLQIQQRLAQIQNDVSLYSEGPSGRAARHEQERIQHRLARRAAHEYHDQAASDSNTNPGVGRAYGRVSSRGDVKFNDTVGGDAGQTVQNMIIQSAVFGSIKPRTN